MLPLILPLPGNEAMAASLAGALPAEVGILTVRHFPDGETYLRIETPIDDRAVLFACTLHRPDDKLLPLLFAAATARELGAAQVALVAPYLAYMRQDRRFQPGEAVTSTYFAKLISGVVDWIVTVDPHLHRHTNLGEVYSVPSTVLHAAPLLSEWIAARVKRPLLIGPDAESIQWVEAVAGAAKAPSIVMEKLRHGDRDVEIRMPSLDQWQGYTPILVDDIISSARTMIEAARHLSGAGLTSPLCLAVHPVFSPGAYEELLRSGVGEVVTCNTIQHPSNGIDVVPLLVSGITERLAGIEGS
jgi:ribose-phosphate pyrophosphokinase